jgi:myo-inositol-1(or 4)-monophosphatase
MITEKYINSCFNYIYKVTRDAGKILVDSFNDPRIIKNKGVIDIVTDADLNCEKFLIDKIKLKYPEHSILSEEDGVTDNKGDFLWIIDPLDGTTNYSRRLPIFCISIAFVYQNEIKFGLVYAPLLNYYFYAIKGKGAFLNKKPINVSNTDDINKSFLVTGFPYDIRTTNDDNVNIFTSLLKQSLAIRRLGSAALDLCFVASGVFDCFWELKLKLWDIAAGGLILEEAGGKFTDLNGKKINYKNNVPLSVIGSNSKIHRNILEILGKIT